MIYWELRFTNEYLGGNDGSFLSDILEFDPLTEQWTLVGSLYEARGVHDVSVINFESGLCVETWCENIFALWFYIFAPSCYCNDKLFSD